MDADDLLRGPRGRRACYEITRRLADQSLSATRGRLEVDGQAACEAVVGACDWAMYWQPPDDVDIELQSSEWLSRLQPAAEAITSSPATSWWISTSSSFSMRTLCSRSTNRR
jgi:hypothetical protein